MRKHLKVLTSFSFLRLRGPDILWYQWIYPTIVAATILLFRHVGTVNVWFRVFTEAGEIRGFDERSIISDIVGLLGVLVGFYIAALAAVASFKSDFLDVPLKGRPTTLKHRRGSNTEREVLNRRRFISVVFGYCASMAIVLYIFGVCLQYARMGDAFFGTVAIAIFYWGLSSLFVVTLLGLHYLVDRMHRE